jgi:hypothetical protein
MNYSSVDAYHASKPNNEQQQQVGSAGK